MAHVLRRLDLLLVTIYCAARAIAISGDRRITLSILSTWRGR